MSRRVAYAVVVTAAVVPRLGVLLYQRSTIVVAFTEKSDRFAETFIHHGTYGLVPGQPSAYTQPLYGWFLIPVYWIFGRSWESVGFAQIRLRFDLNTDAPQDKLDQLLKLTERYCVVYQTICSGPPVEISLQRQ